MGHTNVETLGVFFELPDAPVGTPVDPRVGAPIGAPVDVRLIEPVGAGADTTCCSLPIGVVVFCIDEFVRFTGGS